MNHSVRFLKLVVTVALLTGLARAQGPTGTLIVLNKSEATASLVDLASGEIVATLPTGTGPHEGAVSGDGRTAVVCNYGQRGAPGSTLTVIDVPGRKVTRTVNLGTYQQPHGIVFLPDDERVLVTAEAQKALLVVNVHSGKVEKALDTGQETSHMVAYAPQTGRAYVANIRSGSVSVLDVAAGKRVAIVATGAGAEGLDLSPDGKELWVSNRADDSISILDPETNQVLQRLACASFPIRVKFTPDGRRVLVSNARSGDVAVFDAHTRKEVRRISMELTAVENKEQRLFGDQFGKSPVPVGILIHPSGRWAFVANTNADLVTVIDLNSWRITGRLKTGKEPDGMAFSPLVLRQQADK